jgi:hypothetical protein
VARFLDLPTGWHALSAARECAVRSFREYIRGTPHTPFAALKACCPALNEELGLVSQRVEIAGMFGLFKRGDGMSTAKPSLDSVRFDAASYSLQGDPQTGKVRVWHTPEGDGLGLYFHSLPPDLPAQASSVDELALFYRQKIEDSGGKLIEVRVVDASGCPAVRTVLSIPQQPSGRTYIGSLTVPFRDFSFVLKCQCAEHGPTGFKAALLFDRGRAAGEPIQIEGGRLHVPTFDPDDPKHDAEFPHDPVARVRRVLDHVTCSLTIADGVKQFPGFALPQINAQVHTSPGVGDV